MDEQTNPFVLFIVEDDDDDRLLLSYELKANGLEKGVHFFSKVMELMDIYNSSGQYPLPSLILLNAFLPGTDFQEAFILIQSVEELRTVPIVVMLGSKREKVYLQSYNFNISGYVKKPVDMRIVNRFLRIRSTVPRGELDRLGFTHVTRDDSHRSVGGD